MMLHYVASVYFNPLEPVCFRWFGVYTWMATGPSSQAVSELLPPPSTLAGALISGIAGAVGKFDVNQQGQAKSVDELLEDIRELLKNTGCECGQPVLRGPYIYSEKGIALHVIGGKLVLFGKDGVSIVSPGRVIARGVALRRDKSTVVKHMLYNIEYIDLRQVLGDYSIVVDVLCEKQCSIRLDATVVRLGSEGRIAEMGLKSFENNLAGMVMSRANDKGGGLVFVASPILLEPALAGELINAGRVRLGSLNIRLISMDELKPYFKNVSESSLKDLRARIQMIAAGYDTVRNSLREMYPALMPGSIIHVDPVDVGIMLRGVGKYSSIGWGSIVPLESLIVQ